MTDVKKEGSFCGGAENQDSYLGGSLSMKTISVGWGQEEIKFSCQATAPPPQVSKNRDSYFFVKHP